MFSSDAGLKSWGLDLKENSSILILALHLHKLIDKKSLEMLVNCLSQQPWHWQQQGMGGSSHHHWQPVSSVNHSSSERYKVHTKDKYPYQDKLSVLILEVKEQYINVILNISAFKLLNMTRSKMFPTIFKPVKSILLLKVTVRFIGRLSLLLPGS